MHKLFWFLIQLYLVWVCKDVRQHFGFCLSLTWVGLKPVTLYVTWLVFGLHQWKVNYYYYSLCVGRVTMQKWNMWCLFNVGVVLYWFQTKGAVVRMMKCVLWIFMKNAPLKTCTSLSSSSCHSARHIFTLARSVLHAHSLPSPLTLCVWPAVPLTLIKTTNAPTSPPPPLLTLHCLQLW